MFSLVFSDYQDSGARVKNNDNLVEYSTTSVALLNDFLTEKIELLVAEN